PPEGGRIALSANERIAEFLDFAIQAKFAYVNKLQLPRRGSSFFFETGMRRENIFCTAMQKLDYFSSLCHTNHEGSVRR
ncbi:MAG: hypothetical protein KHW90_11950, partial [Clostridiales bacterium]|nr:hypothetical protein [Clostridiales bacterium]